MSTVTPPAMSHGTLAPVSGSCAPTAAGVLVDELGVTDALVLGLALDDAEADALADVVADALVDALLEALALADAEPLGFGPGGVASAAVPANTNATSAPNSTARIFFTSGTPDGVGGPAAGRRPDVR
jgi:hypothetical protein